MVESIQTQNIDEFLSTLEQHLKDSDEIDLIELQILRV